MTKKQRLSQSLDASDDDDEEDDATKQRRKVRMGEMAERMRMFDEKSERERGIDTDDEGALGSDDDNDNLRCGSEEERDNADDNGACQRALNFNKADGDDDDFGEPRLREENRTPVNVAREMTRNGEARVWMLKTRGWIKNSTPRDEPGCALCLPTLPCHAAPLQLIKMSATLQELALTRGGNSLHATRCAKIFHKHRRKARAQYNRSTCQALFKKESPHCIAFNVMDGKDGPMQLAPSMEHLGSTDELMYVLVSNEMHNDPALHKTWVGLHASGFLCGTTKRPAEANLSSHLSVNYDAHCRMEAAQRLEFQVFM
jgi:hypothetical protein